MQAIPGRILLTFPQPNLGIAQSGQCEHSITSVRIEIGRLPPPLDLKYESRTSVTLENPERLRSPPPQSSRLPSLPGMVLPYLHGASTVRRFLDREPLQTVSEKPGSAAPRGFDLC